jgi:xanthine dehydrogenase YagS FAD-binding subunit
MNPFGYVRATDIDHALAEVHRAGDRPVFLAGGTNLVDLMKEGVASPGQVVDIGRLPLKDITRSPDGSLFIGALASNTATANHPLVKVWAPLVRTAILAGASPQIRNRATNGGNLLQRTRCHYFHDLGVPCNKRLPGSGCPASAGVARQHAILGATADCVATHPSDLCVALAALDAEVHVRSRRGVRVIAFADFHRLPGGRPDLDTTLQPDELVTHLRVPPNHLAAHSAYLKVRERASYAFALVSVAAALELDGEGTVRGARLALGGVAHKPWRDVAAEQVLIGRKPDDTTFVEVARQVLAPARAWGGPAAPEGQPGNQFKITLSERAIVRALGMARDGITTNTGEDACRPFMPWQAPETRP